MEVSLDQYRAAIGLFNRLKFTLCRIVILLPILFLPCYSFGLNVEP